MIRKKYNYFSLFNVNLGSLDENRSRISSRLLWDDNMITCIHKETWKINVTSVQRITNISAGNLYVAGHTIYYLDVYASTRVLRDGICRANGCITRQLNNMIAWHFNNNTYRHFPFSRNDRISIGQKWRKLRARSRTHDRRSTTTAATMTRRIQCCVFVIYRASVRRHNTSVASTSCWNADYNVPRTRENIHTCNYYLCFFFYFINSSFQLDVIESIIWRNLKMCVEELYLIDT